MDKLYMMKTFLMVAQKSSFSRAAEKLDISPQLVSKYVTALEADVQTRLLQRTTRTVSLTEAGRLYASRCAQILDDIEEMENSLVDWHQNVSGLLTVNAPMSFGHRHMPRLILDFQKHYPSVEIKLNLTDHKIDLVEEGVDIALRIGNLKNDHIIAKKISDIKIALLASPDYLKRKGVPCRPSDLSGHNFLSYSYTDQEQLIQELFDLNTETIDLHRTISANNGDFLVNAAILGGGITIQPTFIANDALQQGTLVKILPDYQPNPIGLYLVYANRQFLPHKIRAFIDFISHHYGDTSF
ncbi:LysR family transcriptional regulator [Vibrio sp. HA2012]|nr:LysR family transcriptional regulator [Vibrio sp. HA2012]